MRSPLLLTGLLSLATVLPALAPAGTMKGTVAGRVTADGMPVPGAQVRLQRIGGGLVALAECDAQGGFRLAAGAPGEYRVWASSPAWGDVSRSVAIAAGGETELDIDFTGAGDGKGGKAGPGEVVEVKRQRLPLPATATKTDTPLQDVPAAVEIVSRETITTQGGANLDSSIRNMSGVVQSSSSNYGFFNNYLSRGLNVNYLRDALPDGLTINGYARTLTGVERVEVLKGPGSALYGSGAPGGTINMVMEAPSLERGALFEAGLGGWGARRASADVTGPLGGGPVAARLAAAYSELEGYRGLATRFVDVLPSFIWHVTDRHAFYANLDYRGASVVSDTAGIPFHLSTTKALNRNELTELPQETRLYTPFSSSHQDFFRLALGHRYTQGPGFSLRSNLVFASRRLSLLRNSTSVNFTSEKKLTGRSARTQDDKYNDLLLQLEPVWHLNGGAVGHTLLLGIEYHAIRIATKRSQTSLAPINDVYNPVIPERSKAEILFTPVFDRDVSAEQAALYGQEEMRLGDHWRLRAGLRVDRYEVRDAGNYNKYFNAAPYPFLPGGGFTTTLAPNGQSFIPRVAVLEFEDSRRADTRVSGSFGAVYKPVAATSFYGGIAIGRQAILSSESARTAFAPESSRQYEVGNKSSLWGGRLHLDTALYEVTRSDFLQTINGVSEPVGEQRTRGGESSLQVEPLPGWTVRVNGSVQDAIYTRLTPGSLFIGKKATGVPRYSGGLWTRYELGSGPLAGLSFGGGVTARSAIFIDQANLLRLPGYQLGDLMLGYKRGHWEAQLNLSNVTDRKWFRNGVNSAGLPGDPRNLSGSLRWRF